MTVDILNWVFLQTIQPQGAVVLIPLEYASPFKEVAYPVADLV
jgi:hypothetical protein